MIPKKIHYVWVGGSPIPPQIKTYMNSWKKFLPDFEIKCWDESSFDINSVQFVKEAYESKKFAFVADYIRLHALYQEGGIYLDTDVEVFKDITPFTKHDLFCGFEGNGDVGSGIMGAIPKHPFIKEFMNFYLNKSFYDEKHAPILIPNTVIMNQILDDKYGLIHDNQRHELSQGITVYPSDYFSGLGNFGEIITTPNTYTRHYFCGSWAEGKYKIALKLTSCFPKLFGNCWGPRLKLVLWLLIFEGPIVLGKKIFKHIFKKKK